MSGIKEYFETDEVGDCRRLRFKIDSEGDFFIACFYASGDSEDGLLFSRESAQEMRDFLDRYLQMPEGPLYR